MLRELRRQEGEKTQEHDCRARYAIPSVIGLVTLLSSCAICTKGNWGVEIAEPVGNIFVFPFRVFRHTGDGGR